MSKRARAATIVITAAQFGLACGGGDKVEPSVATSIAAASSVTLQAVAGTSVTERPSVVVKDQRGNPMANVPVTFAVVLGGGSVSSASQTTGPTGTATVGEWVLGTTAGANALTATAAGLPPLTFGATGVVGPASAVAKSNDGQSATVATRVALAPAVTVTDAHGNPVAGAAVTFALVSGGGSITGEAATTGADGVATLGSWTLGITAGPNTLSVTSGSLTPAVFSATGVAAAAAKLVVATQPGDATVGVAIATAPVVYVQDTYGNVDLTATTAVTASLASGEGTLGGTVTVNAVAGVATFNNLVLNDVTHDGTATLHFAASGLTPATSSSFGAFGGALNLTIHGAYLTQATQTYQGDVPLVAGRTALIRVFVKSSRPATVSPAVRVRLYRSGALVQTYTIAAPASSVPTTVNEGSLGSSWNVTVPASVVQPGLSILADVDPTESVAESNESDNSFPSSGIPLALNVRAASTFRVMLVPVVQASNGLQGDVTEANQDSYMDFAWRVYPFSSYDAAVRAPYTYNGALASTYDATWSQLLAEMLALQRLDAGRFYYGVIKPAYASGGTGFGYIGQPAAVGVDWMGAVSPGTNLRAMTAAHEWGHNFSRRHVNCGNPSGIDPYYPYDPGTIGPYGYDIEKGELRDRALQDLMSYCRPLWISDYTYTAVMNFRAATSGGPAAAAPRPSLLVWGRIGPEGVVLEPSFEVNARPSLPERSGPFRLSGTDAAGRELFNFSFAGAEIDHLPNQRHFAFVVPMPAGGVRPAAVRLTANGREAVRLTSTAPGPLGNAPITPAGARLSRLGGARSRLEWDVRTHPMALVRDPATGDILSFARGGRLDIAAPGGELDVTFSDGVSSVRQRIRVAPR